VAIAIHDGSAPTLQARFAREARAGAWKKIQAYSPTPDRDISGHAAKPGTGSIRPGSGTGTSHPGTQKELGPGFWQP